MLTFLGCVQMSNGSNFNRGDTEYHGGLRTDVYQCNQGSYAKPLCYASVILSLVVVVGKSLSFSNLQTKCKGGCDRIRTRD